MTSPFGPDAPAFLSFDSSPNVELRPPRRERTTPRAAARTAQSPDLVVVPFWDGPEGDAWDRITISGRQFAGMAAIDGQGPSLRMDRRGAPGRDGARTVSRGYKPAEIRITLTLWTEEHLADFSMLMLEIHPRRRPDARTAVDVYHPALALLLIERVLITAIGPLKPSGEPGIFECELSATEYAPPRATNATVATMAQSSTWDELQRQLDPTFNSTLQSDDPRGDTPPSASNADPS